MSEKLFDGLLAGSLPIYYGTSSIDQYLPHPHSIIKTSDFANPKDLSEYLKEVASNQTLYDSYFQWKQSLPSEKFKRVLASTAYKYTSLCNVCEKLAEKQGEVPRLEHLMEFENS